MKKILNPFLILLALFASCSTIQPVPSTPNLEPSATETQFIPSLTPTVTSTSTAVPTYTPTKTSTPTLGPTWTPLPTLAWDDAYALIQNLIETNGGCELPCWWGITPGQTTWQEARQWLASFVSRIREDVPVYFKENHVYGEYSAYFDFPEGEKYLLGIRAYPNNW